MTRTNEDRYKKAEKAMKAYVPNHRLMNITDVECGIIDMLTDILHFAAKCNFNSDQLIRMAKSHYTAETEDES